MTLKNVLCVIIFLLLTLFGTITFQLLQCSRGMCHAVITFTKKEMPLKKKLHSKMLKNNVLEK